MKKKKGKKAEKAERSRKKKVDAPVGPPSCTFVTTGTEGIRLDQARGIPICLEAWTSFEVEPGVYTTITIQEWDGGRWFIAEVISPAGEAAEAVDVHAVLDPILFPGKYDGERVLALYKPAEQLDG
jgi:hypothetical protein